MEGESAFEALARVSRSVHDAASALPPNLRAVWAVAVTGRVLQLYSPYFLEKYRLQELLDWAWYAALSNPGEAREPEEILGGIAGLKDEAELEGYAAEVLSIGTHLAGGIRGEKKDLEAAIEYAGFAFALRQIYRQGISAFDPVVPSEYVDRLQIPFFDFASRCLELAKSVADRPLSRDMFDSVALDPGFPPFAGAAGRNPEIGPPDHEIGPL